MRETFIGETIRQRRLELGKTQEKLCAELSEESGGELCEKQGNGLCDPATLSRIENGRQAPSRSRAHALLQQLGLPHEKYYTFSSSGEAEAEALRTTIDDHIHRFQQSLGKEKTQARADALAQLEQLEAMTEAGDNITRQYVLAVRAALGAYGLAERLKMLLEAIQLTVPRFDEGALASRLYSLEEMAVITQIAETYSEAGQHEKAAGIFGQLLTYAQEHYQNVTQPSRYLPWAACSYARELCLTGRYEKSMEIAALGQKACLDYGYCRFLPALLAVMAECRYATGAREQSRRLYCQAYYLYKEVGNACGLARVEEAARKRLGPDFPLQRVSV